MKAECLIRLEEEGGKKIRRTHKLSGGDAAEAMQVEFEDGTLAFLKTVASGNPFEIEVLGLQRFKCPDGVRVPEVLGGTDAYLLLEWIDFGIPRLEFQNRMGEALALSHLQCRGEAYGFDGDHYIGVTPQQNIPLISVQPGSWAVFWWSHRLEPMFRRLGDQALSRKALRLSDCLADLLPDPEAAPSLLHGDLWSGNVNVDIAGRPVMFDPAPYYGHPEADLGMTRMFGGFDQNFYDAYSQNAFLLTGWEERLELYMLYHVLNHACIFNGGYRVQAERIINKYI
ncbi:fructosamine kinase family protein [Kiritimatiellaeota bacterium B1221]|nr:fructosamine kinase family protein [Kiritimatiellaeota bacterium B1221]